MSEEAFRKIRDGLYEVLDALREAKRRDCKECGGAGLIRVSEHTMKLCPACRPVFRPHATPGALDRGREG